MKQLCSCSKQAYQAPLQSDTVSPASLFEMLTFAVRVCHSRPLLEGLKGTSTFLIVSSRSHCTGIGASLPRISCKQRGSPCLLISHIYTNTHTAECVCACARRHTCEPERVQYAHVGVHTFTFVNSCNVDSSRWANEKQLFQPLTAYDMMEFHRIKSGNI